MSTAQVFQATRAALDNSVDQQAFADQFDPSAINATGLNVSDISSQLAQIAGQNKLTGEDLAKGAQYYNENITPFAGNAQWWGPAAKMRAVLQGYGGMNPDFDWQQYMNPSLESGQQKVLGEQLMAEQAKNGGGGFFGDLMGGLGSLGPLISIGSLLMGGLGGFSSLLSGLGSEAGLAAGGMSFAPEAFSSAFIPNASVAAGGMAGLPSFLSGLGAAAGAIPDLESMGMGSTGNGGFVDNPGSDWSGGGATGPSIGNPFGGGGFGAQIQNFMAQNPWVRQVLGGVKGAYGNQQNPLAGALMGYASGMMPGTGGPFSNALGMGSGVLSMFQGMDTNRRMRDAYSQLNSMGDPYAALRQDAMSRLAALNSNPGGTLANLPGYKAGMDAITRQRAAMGQLGSGNLATALLDYGGNIFNQERGAALNQLGAAGDPTRLALAKAQLGAQAGAGNPAIMNGLATLGFGLNRMGL